MSDEPSPTQAEAVLRAYYDRPERGRAWVIFYSRDARGIPFKTERGLLIVFADETSIYLRDCDDAMVMADNITVEAAANMFERSIFY